MVLKMGIDFSILLDPISSTGSLDVSSFDQTHVVREYYRDADGNELPDESHIKSEKVVYVPQQKIRSSIRRH